MLGICYSQPFLNQGEDDVLEVSSQTPDDIPQQSTLLHDVETRATKKMNPALC